MERPTSGWPRLVRTRSCRTSARAAGAFRHAPTADLGGLKAVDAERTAYGIRLEVAREYARLNGLNVLDGHGARDRIGIVAAGKTYLDVGQALARLGLDAAARERHGIRLLKLGLLFPLDPMIVDELADGLDEVIVIEEKRAFVETALKEQLYGRAGAPAIVGKRDRDGSPLVPGDGELDPDRVAEALARCLAVHDGLGGVADRLARPAARLTITTAGPPATARTPYFCSGCPHNRSTRVPEGSLVGAGIGCHAMVLMMEPDRVGDVVGLTQMGGEGAQWIGLASVRGDRPLPAEHRRWDLPPLGQPCTPGRGGRGREHDIQAALQLGGRDDRRPDRWSACVRSRSSRTCSGPRALRGRS